MFALYDPPAPDGLADDPDRRAFGAVTVVECDNPEAPTEVVVVERQPKDGDVFDQLPFALTPGAADQHQAAAGVHRATPPRVVAAGLPDLPVDAVTDILLRRAPRTVSGGPLPRTGVDRRRHHRRAARPRLVLPRGARAARHRQDVHLGRGHRHDCVNEHGWRVGVVAQSHAVVENLLGGVIDAASIRSGWARRRARDARVAGRRREGLRRRSSQKARRLRDRRHRVGLRQRRAVFRGWPSTCWSSRRPVSSAWPTPSRWPRPRATCCCSATRSSCRRSARAPTPNRSTSPRSAGWSRARTRCPSTRLLPRPARTGCTPRCAGRCPGCPTTVGCARARTSAPPAASTAWRPASGC